MINSLKNISPIDGRYAKKTKELSQYFSESALIKYRVYIEIEYILALSKLGLPELNLSIIEAKKIKSIFTKLDEKDILKIKHIENITNHDVKAVEYFIKEKFDNYYYSKSIEYVFNKMHLVFEIRPIFSTYFIENCVTGISDFGSL